MPYQGIRPNNPTATKAAIAVINIIQPGRATCATRPLVKAPIAAPSGTAEYIKPSCAALTCHMPDIAGYSTRTALAMVSNAPISATMPITRLRNRKPNPPASARSGCSRG
ncbi:hypothetical protein D3C72_2112560 [compost metagenome]